VIFCNLWFFSFFIYIKTLFHPLAAHAAAGNSLLYEQKRTERARSVPKIAQGEHRTGGQRAPVINNIVLSAEKAPD